MHALATAYFRSCTQVVVLILHIIQIIRIQCRNTIIAMHESVFLGSMFTKNAKEMESEHGIQGCVTLEKDEYHQSFFFYKQAMLSKYFTCIDNNLGSLN